MVLMLTPEYQSATCAMALPVSNLAMLLDVELEEESLTALLTGFL